MCTLSVEAVAGICDLINAGKGCSIAKLEQPLETDGRKAARI
jgi:hypothetical protein